MTARLQSIDGCPCQCLGEVGYSTEGGVYSDEGFYIAYGRDWLVYQERDRKKKLTVDAGKGIAIFTDTVGRWDDDPTNRIDQNERERIIQNIKRALEWQGEF